MTSPASSAGGQLPPAPPPPPISDHSGGGPPAKDSDGTKLRRIPKMAKVAGHRYDFEWKATFWIGILSGIFVLSGLVYALLHYAYPPENAVLKPREFVTVDAFGVTGVVSPEDIDWYVGPDKAKPILVAINQRNQEIVRLRSDLREQLARLGTIGGTQAGQEIGGFTTSLEGGIWWRPPAGATRQAEATHSPRAVAQLDELRAIVSELELGLVRNVWADTLWRDVIQTKLDTLAAALTKKTAGKASGSAPDSSNSTPREAGIEAPPPYAQALREVLTAAQSFPGAEKTPANAPASDIPRLLEDLQRGFKALHEWLDRQEDPLVHFDFATARFSAPAYGTEVSGLITAIRGGLARLTALRQEQLAALESLRPPRKQTLFWMSPKGSLGEILFWGFFGVMTNLLYNVAESRRNDRFSEREMMVVLTKMLYGPVVSLVLCLAILTGVVNLLGYDVRVWALPLISFLFGYNARKTAALVDELSQKLLGRAAKSIAQGPEAVARERAVSFSFYTDLIQPISMTDLKEKAEAVADKLVKDTVADFESRR